jgi:methyl-accepting chemotaxis protein
MEIAALLNNVSASINGINELTGELTGVIKDVRGGKGMLGKMLTDETLYNDIHTSMGNVNNLTTELTRTSKTLGSKVSEATDGLTQTISEVKKLVEQLNSGNGTISKLMKDDGIYREIEATSHSLNEMILGLKDASNKLSKAAGNGLELTEAFKHNFLIRDYFEQRGYWDAADFERTVETKLDSLRMLEKQLEALKKR